MGRQSLYGKNEIMKKKINENDKRLKEFVKKGGRKGSKKDFLTVLKKAVRP